MSHVGNGENDFEGLEMLEPERAERVKQARIEARDIIDQLEPFYISSWVDLLTKLDNVREDAIQNAKIFDPAFRERRRLECLMKKIEMEENKFKQRAGTVGLIVEGLLVAIWAFLVYFGLSEDDGYLLNMGFLGKIFWYIVLPLAILYISVCSANPLTRWLTSKSSQNVLAS